MLADVVNGENISKKVIAETPNKIKLSMMTMSLLYVLLLIIYYIDYLAIRDWFPNMFR
jgi:hypothetical protein